jgi:hypothetical protein
MSDSRMDRLFFALGRATLDKNEPKAHAVIALIDLVKLVGDEQERRKVLGDDTYEALVLEAARIFGDQTKKWTSEEMTS